LAAAAVVAKDLVERRPCFSCRKCPECVAMDGSKCLLISFEVRPGQVRKKLLLIAFMKVSFVGEKHAPCKKDAKSVAFLSVRRTMFKDDFEILGIWWDKVLGIGISYRPSLDVLRVPSRTFFLFLYAVNFVFVN